MGVHLGRGPTFRTITGERKSKLWEKIGQDVKNLEAAATDPMVLELIKSLIELHKTQDEEIAAAWSRAEEANSRSHYS